MPWPRAGRQALAGDGFDAGEHGVGVAEILRPDLDAPASGQPRGDRGEAIGAACRVDVQPEVRKVDRQPRVRWQGVDLIGQSQIAGSDPLRDRGVLHQLAELVDAAARAPVA